MVVGEGAVDLGEDHVVVARQPLDQHVEGRARGAVAGVPADAERLAAIILEQPVDISLADVDFLDRAAALVPMAGSGALAELLDLRAEHRAALQQHLEAIVIGRVVAAGDLDAAVDVEIMSREIEHRRGAHANQHDVHAAFREAADQFGFEHAGVGAAVAADGDGARAFAMGLGGEGPAERVSVGFGQRVADDPADVIFAQDIGVELVGHGDAEHSEWRIGSTADASSARSLGVGDAEAGDHLAQFLPGGDVGDADFAELLQVEQGQALGEQFAVDHALAEAGDDAEADAPRKLVERRADAPEIVRFDMLEAVPQHDPVDALAGLLGPLRCGCSRSARHRSSAW